MSAACLGLSWHCAVAARVPASARARLDAEMYSPEKLAAMLRPTRGERGARLRGGRDSCRDKDRRRGACGSGGRL